MSAQCECCLGLSALADTWAVRLHQGAWGRQDSLGILSSKRRPGIKASKRHAHVGKCEAGVARCVWHKCQGLLTWRQSEHIVHKHTWHMGSSKQILF